MLVCFKVVVMFADVWLVYISNYVVRVGKKKVGALW